MLQQQHLRGAPRPRIGSGREAAAAAGGRRSTMRLAAGRHHGQQAQQHQHQHPHHPSPHHQREVKRDTRAAVFGAWPSIAVPEGAAVRRFLDAAPRLGGLVLPRPDAQQQQQQQQRQQQPTAAPGDIATVVPRTQQQPQQQQQKVAAAADAAAKQPLHLSWAGSGVYFFWQLGAMAHLAERYDLTRVPMAGASGGAIVAALARCGVDAAHAADAARALSREHRIWERPLGLAGAWGGPLEQWLDSVLPHDAADRCRGGLQVIVTQLPSWRQVAIDDFKDKRDLINAIMASAHVPLLLDMSLSRACRGAACVDGSFPDFFTGANCDHLTRGGAALVFDYYEDPRLVRTGRLDMLGMKRYTQIKRLAALGARYAARLEAEGALDRFDVAPLAKQVQVQQQVQQVQQWGSGNNAAAGLLEGLLADVEAAGGGGAALRAR